jgi:hypothetical protein
MLNDQNTAPTPTDARLLRAVEVLAWLDTADARRLLAEWAKGAPGAWLSEAAAAGVAMGRSPH